MAAELNRIARQMESAVRAGRWKDGSELDFAFHRTLVDAAGSKRLSRTYATVQAETRLCLHLLMGGYRQADDLAAEHVRLADLINDAPLDSILDELMRHFGDPIAALRRAQER